MTYNVFSGTSCPDDVVILSMGADYWWIRTRLSFSTSILLYLGSGAR